MAYILTTKQALTRYTSNTEEALIMQVRKRKLVLHVSNKQGQMLKDAEITIKQTKPYFPLGCATAESILENKSYQKWFTSRFTVTTFDNEMKWYFNEIYQGHENYTVADAMVDFFKGHNISIRGHNIFWDEMNKNMPWVQLLSPTELLSASKRRLTSIMSRYKGQVIAWDVMNEDLHFSFFADRLGKNATLMFYKMAHELDPQTPLFLNDYNTLAHPEDSLSTPSTYIEKIKEIRGFKGNENMTLGIGVEGHFDKPNIPYVRASLDALGTTKMPIWVTELDVVRGPYQVSFPTRMLMFIFLWSEIKTTISFFIF